MANKYIKIILNRINPNGGESWKDWTLCVYRGNKYSDIESIEDVRNLTPIYKINQRTAPWDANGTIRIPDFDQEVAEEGCVYNGPQPLIAPCVEYESEVRADNVGTNKYTFKNVIVLRPMQTNTLYTSFYYSVIGVNESTGAITHLSAVHSYVAGVDFSQDKEDMRKQLLEYDTENETWEPVSDLIEWEQDPTDSESDFDMDSITIGGQSKKGKSFPLICPIEGEVKSLDPDRISGKTASVIARGFYVMEIQNPWERNNREFNYRRLKQYCVRNIVFGRIKQDGQYDSYASKGSEPTYSSMVPVTIEKMLILRKTDAANPDEHIKLSEQGTEGVDDWEVIRRDGLFYNKAKHNELGFNKWNIGTDERVIVFNESSVQQEIRIQMRGTPGHVYTHTFYLIDTYKKYSKPVTVKVVT